MTGIPHVSVDSKYFYKHLNPVIPEPIRARHLLVWCAKRAADDALAPPSGRVKGKEKIREELRTDEGDQLIREIMEDFLAKLGKGTIDTNVFGSHPGQGDSATSLGLPLRAHPRNTSNREVEANAEAVVKR